MGPGAAETALGAIHSLSCDNPARAYSAAPRRLYAMAPSSRRAHAFHTNLAGPCTPGAPNPQPTTGRPRARLHAPAPHFHRAAPPQSIEEPYPIVRENALLQPDAAVNVHDGSPSASATMYAFRC